MEKHRTRRSFLKMVGTCLGAAALASCAKPTATPVPKAEPTKAQATTAATQAPAATKPAATTAATQAPAATKPAATPTPALSTVGSGKTKLEFWINWPGGAWRDAMVAEARLFADKNPDYTVNVLSVDPTKFLASVAGGDAPDAYTTYTAATYAARGALMPLDDLLATSTIKESDYDANAWEGAVWRKKKYAVPCVEHGAIAGFYWNKDLFEKAGLDPEQPPRNPVELKAFSDKLTKVDSSGNLQVIGFDPKDGTCQWWWMFALLWDVPCKPNLWDPEKEQVYLNMPWMVEVLKYIKSFYDKYGPEKVAAFRQSYATWTANAQTGFGSGHQAMLITNATSETQLKAANPDLVKRMGISWIPAVNGRKIQSIGGWGLVIPKGAKQPKGGIKLMETFSTAEAHALSWKLCGSFGSLKTFLQTTDFSSSAGTKWFMGSVLDADRLEGRNLSPIMEEIFQKWMALRDDVIYGKVTAEAGLASLEKEMQTSLAETLKNAPK